MTVGAVKKGDLFAQIQTRLLSAGIAPQSDHMAGLQEHILAFGRQMANEAVAGAALCVTEHDIARAVSDWAEEERGAAQFALAARLDKVALELIAVGHAGGIERSRAMLRLPEEPEELPARLEAKLAGAVRATLPPRSNPEPLLRVMRAMIRELAGIPLEERNDGKGVMPDDNAAQGQDVARPGRTGGSGPAGMVPQQAQLQQAAHVRGGDGSALDGSDPRTVLGGDDRGPIMETHNFDRPPTRGPDARRPAYDKRTWDAAVAACSRWLLDQPADSPAYEDATRMLTAVRCPE